MYAVALTESALDADENYFAVMLPHDVIEPTVAVSEMIWMRQEQGGSVLLAVEVDPAHVSSYGVFDIEVTGDARMKKVVGMVEKPAVEEAPSNLVALFIGSRDFRFLSPHRVRQGQGDAAYRLHRSAHLRRPPRPRHGP